MGSTSETHKSTHGRLGDASLTLSMLLSRSADIDPAAARALASIWDEVVDRIVEEMLSFDLEEKTELHIDLREEMIESLAKMQIWLAERVIERRLNGREATFINPDAERSECLGPLGAAGISATAKRAYEHFWSRRMSERWNPKSIRAFERAANPRRARLVPKPVERNHFIPRWFLRDHWAEQGQLLRWKRSEGKWLSSLKSFGQWGYVNGLYSDRLEAYFALIDGDSKQPIQMLLDRVPLNGPQRNTLVGFLVVQLLRNPQYIRAFHDLAGIHGKVAGGVEYEQLFRDNDFFHRLAHPLMWSRWALLRADSPLFVLPDTFAATGDLGDGLRLIVPLSPLVCFVTLPSRETEKRIVPLLLHADDAMAARLRSLLCRVASRELVSHRSTQVMNGVGDADFAQLLLDIESATSDGPA